jgi:hypothetical protein
MFHSMLFSELNSLNTKATPTGKGRKSTIFMLGRKHVTNTDISGRSNYSSL